MYSVEEIWEEQERQYWVALRAGNYPDYYDNEIIAAALGQVAKEYGYKED